MHIGLIGLGNWGRHILRDLLELKCSVAVVDPSGSTQAVEQGASSIVKRIDDLEPVDGIIVATPATTHAGVLEELVTRRTPIFCEKPLTTDVLRADRLAAMAPSSLFVMDKWRYHPGVEALGAIARSGELGPALGLRTTRIGWGHPHHDTDAIWTLAPHELSIALEILGTIPAPRWASAEYVEGWATGLIAGCGACPHHVLELSVRSETRRREIRLLCRDGIAALPDPHSNHIQVIRNGNLIETQVPIEERAIPTDWPLRRELQAFLDYLRGGPPPKSSAAEGAMIVRTISALRSLAGIPPSSP